MIINTTYELQEIIHKPDDSIAFRTVLAGTSTQELLDIITNNKLDSKKYRILRKIERVETIHDIVWPIGIATK